MPTVALDSVATLQPLARWLPHLRDLPRLPLTSLPTPVQPLERLGRAAGIAPPWIKRDDRSGVIYGGNKPRKLELLLGAARARQRRRVLTFGGLGTHHGLATAACGRAAGLATTLVLVPQPVTPHVQRCLRLLHALGADMHLARGAFDAARRGLALLTRAWLDGEPLALVPTGGTSVLGALGYLNAGLELVEQVRAGQLPEPAAVFVALGSGGTVAGLLAGLRLGGLQSRVVGVLVTDILPPSPGRLVRLARACLAHYAPNAGVSIRGSDLDVERRFLGSGYGAVTPEATAARRTLEECEGIPLETTYTGKCLAALLRHASMPALRGRPVLFWDTFSSMEPSNVPEELPRDDTLPPEIQRFLREPAADTACPASP
jgi:1-aminocyclopropane-1-carboxylate deaminase/D-cysteine desulfhydrase-like pyridoxal-dependent ACC family enzyme